MKKIIQQGAEAIIFREDNKIIKQRIKKSYRLPQIDEKLRRSRTKSESKILTKLYSVINVPKIIKIDLEKKEIIMEYIEGKKLSDCLENLPYKKICKQIAFLITKLHDAGIIHGDLTTSNMIYTKDKKVYLIDFGLSFHSHKIEDKAVDLHLLKQAFKAKHFNIASECIETIFKNYKAEKREEILERIKAIEKRGRYR